MFTIIGIVIVFGAVLAGFLMEKGPLAVLVQPSEFVIIGGAAVGTRVRVTAAAVPELVGRWCGWLSVGSVVPRRGLLR